MSRKAIRKFLFEHSWDTSCRNVDVAAALRSVCRGDLTILDAGSGENGLAAFLPESRIFGIDIQPPPGGVKGTPFVVASIDSLPFQPGSVSVAAAVDVLEHLPPDLRVKAVEQLVRTAKNAVVIAFPFGREARKIDEGLSDSLSSAGMPVPDWLSEHLAHEYPEPDAIAAEVERQSKVLGRRVRISIRYSERLSVARALRRASVRSKYLYIAGNLGFGLLRPILSNANRENSYRVIIAAEFEDA